MQNKPSRTGPSILLIVACAIPILIVLVALPRFVEIYQLQLFTYGLIYAIAALGFNLLLGYTGLLSFGHSAYFGIGAYSAAFMVKYFGVGSIEVYILVGLVFTGLISAAFGYVCVRHTRIFFGILTLALSQVLWTLAYKFFWVTGGTDGLRVAFANLTLLGGLIDFKGRNAYQAFVHSYYYYVLFLFCICTLLMWVIVHSPFGKALQAICDNETRAQFLGIPIRRYRWLAFLLSGSFTGLAGILWVPLNGLVTPDILYWPFSGEIVFMTVLGGFRTFSGPIIGAIVFNYLKVYAVASTAYWHSYSAPCCWCWYWHCRRVLSERCHASSASSGRGDDMNLLETINLKKYFGDTRAVDNVSLTVAEREFVSLVGPNGAGKTSLINVISALLPSDSGKILFKGDDITQSTVTERVKAGIARSFQIVNLFDDLTAFDNVDARRSFPVEGKTANLAGARASRSTR